MPTPRKTDSALKVVLKLTEARPSVVSMWISKSPALLNEQSGNHLERHLNAHSDGLKHRLGQPLADLTSHDLEAKAPAGEGR